MELNSGQKAAVKAMLDFTYSSAPYFLLQGSAGTGKTRCLAEFSDTLLGKVIFTAPTNKAVGVLRKTLTSTTYTPDCKTIHSLLGLKLTATGEVKELTAPKELYEISARVVIVDEASMIGEELAKYIKKANKEVGARFIFVGDPYQLPPVGEPQPAIWDFPFQAEPATLTEIVRNKDAIACFGGVLREGVAQPFKSLMPHLAPFKNEDAKGIIKRLVADGLFQSGEAKIVAWRNKTVDKWNKEVRKELFKESKTHRWLPTDRVVLAAPANSGGAVIATTDTEGVITRVEVSYHPNWKQYKVYNLSVTTDDNLKLVFQVLHEDSEKLFKEKEQELLLEARANYRRWETFWGFKDAFHNVRHSYAITSHRSQGSTLTATLVDFADIFANQNSVEARRCFYVACTRPRSLLQLI